MVVSTACAAFTCRTGEFHSDDLFVVVVGLCAHKPSRGARVILGEHFQPARVPINLGVTNLLHSESVELGHQIVLPEGRA